MKRPIKFRGIAVDTGEMVYGSLIQEEDVSTIVYYANEDDEEPIFHRVIPETVGQFTGLLDKNGKEIFEGDLVKYDWRRGKTKSGTVITDVYWDNMFKVRKNETVLTDVAVLRIISLRCEVVGNIHEHPELITPP